MAHFVVLWWYYQQFSSATLRDPLEGLVKEWRGDVRGERSQDKREKNKPLGLVRIARICLDLEFTKYVHMCAGVCLCVYTHFMCNQAVKNLGNTRTGHHHEHCHWEMDGQGAPLGVVSWGHHSCSILTTEAYGTSDKFKMMNILIEESEERAVFLKMSPR